MIQGYYNAQHISVVSQDLLGKVTRFCVVSSVYALFCLSLTFCSFYLE